MLVVDANILIRAALGRRVRQLLDRYAPHCRFFAPDVAYGDARKYLPRLLKKRDKPCADVPAFFDYLQTIVRPVDRKLYGVFEHDARRRLRGRDEEDWPVLAAALALQCAIWTEDTDFFGTGVTVWTTNRVEIFLERQQKT